MHVASSARIFFTYNRSQDFLFLDKFPFQEFSFLLGIVTLPPVISKVPELEFELKFETIDTVVHGSSSDWNLRTYLPQVKASTVKRVFSASIQRLRRIRNWTI